MMTRNSPSLQTRRPASARPAAKSTRNLYFLIAGSNFDNLELGLQYGTNDSWEPLTRCFLLSRFRRFRHAQVAGILGDLAAKLGNEQNEDDAGDDDAEEGHYEEGDHGLEVTQGQKQTAEGQPWRIRTVVIKKIKEGDP
ncbi:hypothetical protein VTI74DRAFT_4817 [Chaetomium olivicolor]